MSVALIPRVLISVSNTRLLVLFLKHVDFSTYSHQGYSHSVRVIGSTNIRKVLQHLKSYNVTPLRLVTLCLQKGIEMR